MTIFFRLRIRRWGKLTFFQRCGFKAKQEQAATNQQFPTTPWFRSWELIPSTNRWGSAEISCGTRTTVTSFIFSKMFGWGVRVDPLPVVSYARSFPLHPARRRFAVEQRCVGGRELRVFKQLLVLDAGLLQLGIVLVFVRDHGGWHGRHTEASQLQVKVMTGEDFRLR